MTCDCRKFAHDPGCTRPEHSIRTLVEVSAAGIDAARQAAEEMRRGDCYFLALDLIDALSKIAAPKRPDGTYNLSREACEQIARAALGGLA